MVIAVSIRRDVSTAGPAPNISDKASTRRYVSTSPCLKLERSLLLGKHSSDFQNQRVEIPKETTFVVNLYLLRAF